MDVRASPLPSVVVPPRASSASPSFRDLFDAHASYVWHTFRHLGVPDADVEDLTQDLFLEVRRHLEDYDPERPIRPWLFGFAFRIAAQHRRRTYIRRAAPLDVAETVADPAPPQDEALVRGGDWRLCLEAMESIELEKRAVFILYEIDGEKMSDIAAAMGIPANTAYSRLRLARAELAAAAKRLLARRGEPR